MEKIFNHKVLIILFGHLREVELTYRYIFAFKFTLRSQQPDIVPIMSITIAKLGAKVAAGAVAILPPVSLLLLSTIPVANLLPVHLDIIQNGPNEILWGWGETDS
jgi:hypothetical protein